MEFWEFTKAVFDGWVEKVGLILTILPFLEKIPIVKGWLQDKPIIDRFNITIWIIGGSCVFWGFYAAWSDQHHAAIEAQNKLDQLRPYATIEELSSAQIRARAMANPGNKVMPEGAYERGYVFGKTPNGETLIYNYRNVGKIPAKGITHYQKVIVLDEGGVETVVPITSTTNTKGELLYPDQFATYVVIVPSGTVFTGSTNAKGSVRIILLMTYAGKDSDKNVYFYKVVLKVGRYANPEAMNQTAIGGLSVESRDEGILKDLNGLLN